MKDKLLFIDTTDKQLVRLGLVAEKVIEHKFESSNLSEQLLAEIKTFLGKNKIKISELTKIAVVLGPGGFSRIRTAVSTANALAFGLKIPVTGLSSHQIPANLEELKKFKAQKMVAPAYGAQPNITLQKK